MSENRRLIDELADIIIKNRKDFPSNIAQKLKIFLSKEGYGKMISCPNFIPGCGENGSCPYGEDKCTNEEEPKIFRVIE